MSGCIGNDQQNFETRNLMFVGFSDLLRGRKR